MSPYAKFGLDRPVVRPAIGNRQTDKQTDKHIAFYYVDCMCTVRPTAGLNAATDRHESRHAGELKYLQGETTPTHISLCRFVSAHQHQKHRRSSLLTAGFRHRQRHSVTPIVVLGNPQARRRQIVLFDESERASS